jgi:hypothetical protein
MAAHLLQEILVDSDGIIKRVSTGTPAALFGLDPAVLAGVSLHKVVDVFHEYAGTGGHCSLCAAGSHGWGRLLQECSTQVH